MSSDSEYEHAVETRCGSTENPSELDRTESKLDSSIKTYGTNSYYYAHSRSKNFVVPDDAKVVTGPGIITGGTPVKLAETPAAGGFTKIKRKITKYSWCDEDDKVTVYIDDSEILEFLTLENEERFLFSLIPKASLQKSHPRASHRLFTS